MVAFIDSSSLVKRYIEEHGSNDIDRYYIQENKICIAPITILEINSALCRKLSDGSITEES